MRQNFDEICPKLRHKFFGGVVGLELAARELPTPIPPLHQKICVAISDRFHQNSVALQQLRSQHKDAKIYPSELVGLIGPLELAFQK